MCETSSYIQVLRSRHGASLNGAHEQLDYKGFKKKERKKEREKKEKRREMKSSRKVRRRSGLIPSLCSRNSKTRTEHLLSPSHQIPTEPLIQTPNVSRWWLVHCYLFPPPLPPPLLSFLLGSLFLCAWHCWLTMAKRQRSVWGLIMLNHWPHKGEDRGETRTCPRTAPTFHP